MSKLFSYLLVSVLVLAPQTHAQRKAGKNSPSLPANGNADYINAEQLRDYLTFVASDEMEGRGTPSRGLDTTARYLASQLSRWGLKPAGDNGTFFQRIPLRRGKIDPAQTRVEINGESISFGDDFVTHEAGTATGPLVYVGHGWVVKSKDIDAYKGVDVRDKIVIMLDGQMPKGLRYGELSGKEGENWDTPGNAARKRGAKGVIYIPQFQRLVNWPTSRPSLADGGWLEESLFLRIASLDFLPSFTVSTRVLNSLFQNEKYSAEMVFNRAAANDPVEAFELKPEKKASFTIVSKSEQSSTQNVVAVLQGSDPVLQNEYVAIGAHYDHLGIGVPESGDAIYNGADDDGSGVVSVLAMAEAFARGPRAKRSLLFIWHAGEEGGLRGSRYFTDHPTVPLSQIVAYLNLDMVGRTRRENDDPKNQSLPEPGGIFVIGSKRMSTELGEISERVNQSYLNLKFDYRYDDPKDPQRLFFRSDHYRYALKGIPVIFYTDGTHADYHRPSDTADKIDYQNMEKVARTVYATAWELANRANRPVVDKPLK